MGHLYLIFKKPQNDRFKSHKNQMTNLANDPKYQMIDLNQPNGRCQMTYLNPKWQIQK
jgi:hypothetical protein